MGYRHHMYAVERSRVFEITKLSPDELKQYAANNGIHNEDDDNEFSPYEFLDCLCGDEFHDFGKYYENSENIYKKGVPLFMNKETQELFEEHKPYVVERVAVLCAIEDYRQKIVNWYKELLMTQEEYDASHTLTFRHKDSQEARVRKHLENQLKEWENRYGYTAIDTDMNSVHISRSWLYEYAIFELAHKLKMFDWEKYMLVFYGW